MRTRRRIRDEQGLVLPTRLMVFSISAVALCGLVFVATQGDDGDDVATPASSKPSTSVSATTTPKPKPTAGGPTMSGPVTTAPEITIEPSPTERPKAPVKRSEVLVVVFNNSNVKGLAGRTATRAEGVGWSIAGTDNWYGTVDASTVYYGPELKDAATLLAKDLGIATVKPAVNPMRADRLTVILTATYAQQ